MGADSWVGATREEVIEHLRHTPASHLRLSSGFVHCVADAGLLNCGGTLGDPLETSLSGDPELGSLVLVSDSRSSFRDPSSQGTLAPS